MYGEVAEGASYIGYRFAINEPSCPCHTHPSVISVKACLRPRLGHSDASSCASLPPPVALGRGEPLPASLSNVTCTDPSTQVQRILPPWSLLEPSGACFGPSRVRFGPSGAFSEPTFALRGLLLFFGLRHIRVALLTPYRDGPYWKRAIVLCWMV